MIIPIGDKYRITSDSLQWTVQKSKNNKSKPGGVVWNSESYFPTLEFAFRALGERMIRESDAIGVVEAVAAVGQVVARLNAAVPTLMNVNTMPAGLNTAVQRKKK